MPQSPLVLEYEEYQAQVRQIDQDFASLESAVQQDLQPLVLAATQSLHRDVVALLNGLGNVVFVQILKV